VTVPAAARGSRRWIGIAGVLLLGALAYSSSLRGEFAFDDLPQIVQNPAIRDLGSFVGPGSRGILPNRYVAYLTFAMSYQAGGLDPFGWHLANLAIHLTSAVLVWTLVRLAFRTPRLRSSKLAPSSGAIAFAAAALFVAHPLATQAVSYVVQRITSLTTLFYLLARDLSADRARVILGDLLRFLAVAGIDQETVEEALELPYTDSEDAVQMVAATQAGAEYLITRNATGYKAGPLRALQPAELLALL